MQQRPKRLVHIARERRAVGRIAHVVARSPVSNDSADTFGLRTNRSIDLAASSPHYQAVGALALGQRKLGVEVGAVAHQRAVASPRGRVLRAVLRVCLSTKASDSLLDRTLKKVNRLEWFGTVTHKGHTR